MHGGGLKAQAEQNLASELSYTRREWFVQRIGWLCMVTLIVAACLGFFGGGGVSMRVAEGQSTSLQVRYERFARYASDSTLEFTVAESHGKSEIVLEADEHYFRAFEIQSITPEPQSVASAGGRLQFHFKSDRSAASITLRLKPKRVGTQAGKFQLQGRSAIAIEQFVYP